MAKDLVRLAEQGERLRALRRPIPGTGEGGRVRYEIPQEAAADAAGVKLRAYQAYEGGTSDIGWERVVLLAEFFGTTPQFIVEGDSGPTQLDRIEAMLSVLVADRGLGDQVAEALGATPSGAVPFGPALAAARSTPEAPTDATPPETPAADAGPRRRARSTA